MKHYLKHKADPSSMPPGVTGAVSYVKRAKSFIDSFPQGTLHAGNHPFLRRWTHTSSNETIGEFLVNKQTNEVLIRILNDPASDLFEGVATYYVRTKSWPDFLNMNGWDSGLQW